MMHTWFRCVARYEKVAENGMNVKVSEPYLVDALSYTEAESRFIAELTPFINGEFTVSDIRRANYSEIFESATGDRWFECKIMFITLDEKSGAEKHISTRVLVQAADLREAIANLDAAMKGTLADYVIASVKETPLMEIFKYEVEEETEAASDESASVAESGSVDADSTAGKSTDKPDLISLDAHYDILSGKFIHPD